MDSHWATSLLNKFFAKNSLICHLIGVNNLPKNAYIPIHDDRQIPFDELNEFAGLLST
jgi:hypothetical protein